MSGDEKATPPRSVVPADGDTSLVLPLSTKGLSVGVGAGKGGGGGGGGGGG